VPLERYVNESNKQLATAEVLDVLGLMLQINPEKRPTVSQLLKHSYFSK